MAFSASLGLSFPLVTSHPCSLLLSGQSSLKQNRARGIPAVRTNSCFVKAALDSKKPGVVNGWSAAESARNVLERLFAQSRRRLEEQSSRDSDFSSNGANPEILEADIAAVLEALTKKEDDLQYAERKVEVEYGELERARKELSRREAEIAAVSGKCEMLEAELKQLNLDLASQTKQIEDLRLELRERDRQVSAARSALSLKEDEMEKKLSYKSRKFAKLDMEFQTKGDLLNIANQMINNQETEIEELRNAIREKEKELETLESLRKLDQEKLNASEENLKKQAMEWLLAEQDLKKMAAEESNELVENNETLEHYRRVKQLLVDVRSELISSQKSLASSKKQMEERELILKSRLAELEEDRLGLASRITSLRDAKREVEKEKAQLDVIEARNKEFERDFASEKEIVEELRVSLRNEKSSLEQATREMSMVRLELEKQNTDFRNLQGVLPVKESELAEAKVEIQRLGSERESLLVAVEEKDSRLETAKEKLNEVNHQVAELRKVLNSKETQLHQATAKLNEKEEGMQNQLNDTRLKVAEAGSVVEWMVDLTNKLVLSDRQTIDFTIPDRQLEIELEFVRKSELDLVRESLMNKEMELKKRDEELRRLKEEMVVDGYDLKKLYALALERLGEKTVGELGIEKLQLEAMQLEVEVAKAELQKLTEMSRRLNELAGESLEADTDTVLKEMTRFSDLTDRLVKEAGLGDSRRLAEKAGESLDPDTDIGGIFQGEDTVLKEMARLSDLTDQLVKEAGLGDSD
ncbi:unnamed protein product [Linum trigynum]|uniref:Uncharacterized protein n=1 Tax=Linum trigynum TaxID=586398 RepID=A0AAV2DMZ4_9ROSI